MTMIFDDYGQAADHDYDADHAAYEAYAAGKCRGHQFPSQVPNTTAIDAVSGEIRFDIAEAGTITEGSIMRVRNHQGFGHGLRPGTDSDMNCLSCQREDAARRDATADFTAACERTVAGGRCTGCEQEAAELLPWTPRERLCWACTDLQLDLMAKAIGEMVTS